MLPESPSLVAASLSSLRSPRFSSSSPISSSSTSLSSSFAFGGATDSSSLISSGGAEGSTSVTSFAAPSSPILPSISEDPVPLPSSLFPLPSSSSLPDRRNGVSSRLFRSLSLFFSLSSLFFALLMKVPVVTSYRIRERGHPSDRFSIFNPFSFFDLIRKTIKNELFKKKKRKKEKFHSQRRRGRSVPVDAPSSSD